MQPEGRGAPGPGARTRRRSRARSMAVSGPERPPSRGSRAGGRPSALAKDSDSSWREKGAFIASHAEVSAGPEMSVTFHVRAMNASLRSLMHNNVTHYTVSR